MAERVNIERSRTILISVTDTDGKYTDRTRDEKLSWDDERLAERFAELCDDVDDLSSIDEILKGHVDGSWAMRSAIRSAAGRNVQLFYGLGFLIDPSDKWYTRQERHRLLQFLADLRRQGLGFYDMVAEFRLEGASRTKRIILDNFDDLDGDLAIDPKLVSAATAIKNLDPATVSTPKVRIVRGDT